MPHQLFLSPHGRLLLEETSDGAVADAFAVDPAWVAAFAESSARGLLALAGQRQNSAVWPAAWAFWREFGAAYLTALAHPQPLRSWTNSSAAREDS